MQNNFISCCSILAIFAPAAFAADLMTPNRKLNIEKADLQSLKRASHKRSDGTDLAQRYQKYIASMVEFTTSKTDYIEVWTEFGPYYYDDRCRGTVMPSALLGTADRQENKILNKAWSARTSLVKMSSIAALDDIDAHHKWTIPKNIEELKPKFR